MNGTVSEWIAKAEGDFATARREFDVSHHPNFDAVCFHAQQCVEKLMKAVLISHGVASPRIHDLVQLAGLLNAHLPGWAPDMDSLRLLSQGAVTFRYPDECATRDDAEESLNICTRIQSDLRRFLAAGGGA